MISLNAPARPLHLINHVGIPVSINPFFPRLRSAPGSFNGLHPKSKFLAIICATRILTYDPATANAIWEGTPITRTDPIPQ